MKYVRKQGELLISTRLRQLSFLFWENRVQIYQEHNVKFKPNWGTVAALIRENDNYSLNDIALELGFAHTSVLKIVNDMKMAGFLETKQDINDGRRRILSLTKTGNAEHEKMKTLTKSIEKVNSVLLKNSGLLDAMAKVEEKFKESSYYDHFNRIIDKPIQS